MGLGALVAGASVILDAAVPRFLSGHRADSGVPEQSNDFATEADLAIERQVVTAQEDVTEIGVYGAEFGGQVVDSPWALDPVDGTFDYAAGLPTAAMLLGLLYAGTPVAGLIWLPFTDQRHTAVQGGPLMRNLVPQSSWALDGLAEVLVGVGALSADTRGKFPGCYRLAVLEKPTRVWSRLHMHGSPGIDLAFVADRILGATVSFGGDVWDHAAGIVLVQAAGGVVTNLAGEPWTLTSRSVLAPEPGVHGQVLDILHDMGEPEKY